MPRAALKTIITPLLFLITISLAGCSVGQQAETTGTTIGYGTVSEITQTVTVEESGSISPRQVATVSWVTQGTIGNILVQVGQAVKADDILMTLDQASLPESVRLSQLKLAQMTSPAAIAEAEQAVLDAQSSLTTAQYARTNLDYKDQGTIDNAYYEYVLAKEKYEKAKTDYDNWADEDASDHYETDLAPYYTAMYNAKTEMDSKEYVYELYNSNSSAQTIAEYDSAVTLAENKLVEAQNYLAAITGKSVPADATGDKLLTYYQTKLSVDAVNLRAPFDGIVGAIYDEPGILVSNNHASLVLVDRSEFTTTITVDESSVIMLAEGMKAAISVDVLPEKAFTGTVRMIEPVGKVSNGVVYYDVEVVLDQADAQIPLNATTQVSIQVGEPVTSLVVPATAVQSDTTGEYVQTVDNGVTARVDVVSGTILSDDTVIVTGNLTPGQQVVLILSTSTNTSSNGMGGLFGPGITTGGGGGPSNSGGQVPSDGGAPAPNGN